MKGRGPGAVLGGGALEKEWGRKERNGMEGKEGRRGRRGEARKSVEEVSKAEFGKGRKLGGKEA